MALMVVGVVVGVGVIVWAIVTSVSGIAGGPSYTSGTGLEVALIEGQEMGVWVRGHFDNCTITDPSGDPVTINTSLQGYITVYNFDLVGSVAPSTTGIYQVTCDGDGSFQYKIAPVVNTTRMIVGSLVGGLILLLLFGGGIALLLVRLLRRPAASTQPR
ncbi:MAG: hypothetical protein LBK54_05960 [Propionibacteriaceae bacterium]|nr:hypothetical protein [Propionibacteriaceae bacterium]